MKMIVTVGLRREGLHKARETGVTPDFKSIFNDFSGVRFVEVFGRGRYADFEMTNEGFEKVKENFRGVFSFSKQKLLDPFFKPQ